MISRNGKDLYSAVSLFLLLVNRSGCLAEIRRSVCISNSQTILCVSFYRTDSGLCIYDLFVSLNLTFCSISNGSPSPTIRFKSYALFVIIYLHSLIIWLIVSSLSSHNLHLLFYCVFLVFLSYSQSQWTCFVLLWEVIQFLSYGFLFLAMSKL